MLTPRPAQLSVEKLLQIKDATCRLRQEILCERLLDREILKQQVVANRLGVSQTVAREAFKRLIVEGFAKINWRGLPEVVALNHLEVWELTTRRELIEEFVLALSIPNMSGTDFIKFDTIMSRVDLMKPASVNMEYATELYRAIFAPARNNDAIGEVYNLRLKFDKYLNYYWKKPRNTKYFFDDYKVILELCKSGDVKSSRSALAQHISSYGCAIMLQLREQSGFSELKFIPEI
ncbi:MULTISPECIES: GntR family transcriptional regulator [unclassified Methylobacterium]|jgi:DNA-binding GntR family transcriptional regulator|uniref:GntR family transcriptional regulator n=1 Tax=unclassified Methylobacterium TaxID=2615210 RepID=UPI0008EE10FE|nr:MULTISPECIES: GntR family transcriptional regulator [unclassified Methylobacterium]MDE4909540.1 GntR family transcriptional regulator [Methylobacterium sp. 092160098-2]SFU93176.1 DNA-binding transcriptional regulator, GntR family [Methylobacterium sp. UNCCL125]